MNQQQKEAIKSLRANRDETVRQLMAVRDSDIRRVWRTTSATINEHRAWCKQEVSKILGK